MSMCRARAAWRTHASAWNGCCSILSGALAAVERLAPHAIPAGPGTDEYDWEEDGDRIEIDTIAVYDKTADSWSVRKPVSGPAGGYLRGGRVGVGFEGKLYLVGGRTTAVDIYDPDKNSWSSGPPLPLYDYSDPEAPKLIDYDNDGPDLRHHDRFVVRYGPTVSVFNGSIVVVAGGARGSVVLKNGEWRLGPHLPGELFETGSTIPYASAAVARV